MRHDVAEVDGGEALVVLLQSVEFLGVEAEAGHAGVDVEYCWEFAVGVARVGGPGVEFRERAEDRDNVVGEIVGFAAGYWAAQYREQRAGYDFADRKCFVEEGDEEVSAAGGVECLCDGACAEAVAVGFDYGGDGA